MAIVIDPGAGSLAQGIAQLGAGLSQDINRRQIREREISQNPAQLAALAPAVRQAQDAGTLNQLAESIGVRPDFLARAGAGFQETPQQEAERVQTAAFLESGGPAATGRGAALQAQVGEEQARGTLDRGIIGQQLDTLSAQLETQLGDAVIRGQEQDLIEQLNLVELRAGTEAGELENTVLQQALENSILEIRTEEDGFAKLFVDSEIAQRRAQVAGATLEVDTINKWNDFIGTLDPESETYKAAVAAGIRPSFLQYMQHRERLSLTDLVEGASLTGDPKDRLALTQQIQDAQVDSFERLTRLENEDADQDVIEAARLVFENSRRNAIHYMDEGLILPINVIGADPRDPGFIGGLVGGGPEGVDFFGEEIPLYGGEVESPAVRRILNFIGWGKASPADLGGTNEQGQTVIEALSEEEQAEFFAHIGSLGERVARVASGLTPQQMPPVTEEHVANMREMLEGLRDKEDSGARTETLANRLEEQIELFERELGRQGREERRQEGEEADGEEPPANLVAEYEAALRARNAINTEIPEMLVGDFSGQEIFNKRQEAVEQARKAGRLFNQMSPEQRTRASRIARRISGD